MDFSSSFNINELDIEPFEQIKHSLYETQNFIEMTPPKIQPEDVNDYMVRLLSENTSLLLTFLIKCKNAILFTQKLQLKSFK